MREYTDFEELLHNKLEKLQDALNEAIEEILEHNSEYHHVTTSSKIEEWRKLL